jgi:hypothetical protein
LKSDFISENLIYLEYYKNVQSRSWINITCSVTTQFHGDRRSEVTARSGFLRREMSDTCDSIRIVGLGAKNFEEPAASSFMVFSLVLSSR